ncbi:MAG: hypothetical protein JWR61_898 [Ferruginibacter sp.]|uniref:hypothetical protein n=1 Tax=Ferruginibacter sp. TaxID=1940288 RepID=UPI0026583493|nr:hypothetical protein [Ferruginibacter sp.]MDB5275943.1 hypothetical protein [Ferruginibacter sp.]
MNTSFYAYLQQLELLGFFTGYPLLYAATLFIAGNQPVKNNLKSRVVSLLPFAYALVGTLYLGLQLKNLYPHYSFENVRLSIQHPWLTGWAILAVLFWIPFLAKKKVLSLFHSLVFFFLFVSDLLSNLKQPSSGAAAIRNDMKIYTGSLLFNLSAFALVVCLFFIANYFKRKSQ